MTERKKKRKPRPQRRVVGPSRPAVEDPAATDARLRRASRVAWVLGIAVLVGGLGVQSLAPRSLAGLGQWGALTLRIGGIGLVIAGWILNRARRRA